MAIATRRSIIIWDISTNANRLELHLPKTTKRGSADVDVLRWSENGQYVAALSRKNRQIYIWTSHDGKLIQTLNTGSEIRSFDISANGAHIATIARHASSRAIQIWNRVTGSPVCTLNAKIPFKVFSKEGKPTLVTFGPNGKRIAVGYTNGNVLLWESDPMQAAEIWRNRRAGR
jgi:WD40 repeat protein